MTKMNVELPENLIRKLAALQHRNILARREPDFDLFEAIERFLTASDNIGVAFATLAFIVGLQLREVSKENGDYLTVDFLELTLVIATTKEESIQ